ncbi:MAG: hypothetical protein U1D06_07135, partial [Paracoccaceae bacterium]|nr:hypothetical protein [Paracoccaceae bacterium]
LFLLLRFPAFGQYDDLLSIRCLPFGMTAMHQTHSLAIGNTVSGKLATAHRRIYRVFQIPFNLLTRFRQNAQNQRQ